MRWESGASSFSRMSRSTPVCSPRTSSRTCLPRDRETSRTSLGKPRMPSASGRILLARTSWCSLLERSSVRLAKLSNSSHRRVRPASTAVACSLRMCRTPSRRATSSRLLRSMLSPSAAIVSQSRACVVRNASSESTKGRSCRASTSDSPARPTSLVRLSADTRTTRSN